MSRRTVVIVAAAALVVVAMAWVLRPQPIYADLAEAARGDLQVSVRDEGQTRLKDVYVVSAPVAGRVLRIEIEVGDSIVAGETVLATFQPSDPSILDVRSRSEAESQVQAAEAAVQLAIAEKQRADAELEYAESELRRKQPLAQRGTISSSELDRALLEVDRARAQRSQARANVGVRRSELQVARAALIGASNDGDEGVAVIPVRAPIDGRVMLIMQESEAVVAAGTPIMEVGDASRLEIVVDLLSTDAVRVSEGDPVVIEQWGGEADLAGIVRRVEPFGFTKISALGIEEQRVNVIIDLTSPREAWRSLGHGYRVETRIIIEERRDVINIPVSALFRNGVKWAVFVVSDGLAQQREIELGQRNSLIAEVREGLEAGEAVILHPSDRIADGVSVRARP